MLGGYVTTTTAYSAPRSPQALATELADLQRRLALAVASKARDTPPVGSGQVLGIGQAGNGQTILLWAQGCALSPALKCQMCRRSVALPPGTVRQRLTTPYGVRITPAAAA